MTDMIDELESALAHWDETDPALADVARRAAPDLAEWEWSQDDPFRALVTSVCHQLVSLAAGRTIFGRLEAAVGISPPAIATAGFDVVKSVGLTKTKAACVIDLAERALDGRIDFGALAERSDQQIIDDLTAVRGIGVWTAKMFLLSNLGRPDVCPYEDLGIRQSAEVLYGLDPKSSMAWLRDEAQPRWSPHNSMAARVLWWERRRQMAAD